MVIGLRQLLLAMMFTFAALGVSSANSVYLAQTAQGSGSGADCADALAVAYFNTSSNWTSSTPTGTKIGPGTTVYLCGTITSDLKFQANGSAGSPIVLDGTGATVAADIHVTTNYWTLQNLTYSTGWAASTLAAQALDINGAAYGLIQNNHIDVQNVAMVIWLGQTAHDVTIQNNYLGIRTSVGGDGIDTDILETESSYNILVQGNYFRMAIDAGDNTCSNCHDDIIQVWASTGPTYNWTIRNNYFVQNSPGKNQNLSMFMMQSIGTGTLGYWNVYSNVFQCIAGATGANGINFYGLASGQTINIYNNTIVENTGGCNNMLNLDSVGTYDLRNNIIYAADNRTMLTGAGTVNRSKNLWYGPTAPSCSGTTDLCGQDPLFTNYGGSDFSLQSGSPAIGLGTNLGTSYNQYPLPETTWPNPALGTRPSTGAWDAGAYDPLGGLTPPTGLTAAAK